jgi:hypothetical protein
VPAVGVDVCGGAAELPCDDDPLEGELACARQLPENTAALKTKSNIVFFIGALRNSSFHFRCSLGIERKTRTARLANTSPAVACNLLPTCFLNNGGVVVASYFCMTPVMTRP